MITLSQTLTAIGPGITSSFQGAGGVAPYVYSVVAGGAGGTINSSTGIFTAPAALNPNPKLSTTTIKVVDDNFDEATATILIGSPLLLFCDVIQKGLGLPNGRVILWDQKLELPTDSNLFITVSNPSCKPFGNVNRPRSVSGGFTSEQYMPMQALLDIDIMSRGPAARDRKEEVLLALNSNYALQQQYANSFYIGKLPASARFINLSELDGAAIPYRYRISINIQYAFSKVSNVDYFDDFSDEIVTDV